MIGIVIVTYNSEKYLENCLSSAGAELDTVKNEAEKYPGRRTVVVVDNASEDGSVTLIEKKFPKAELIKNKQNKGFAWAANQGIRQCLLQGCRYVLLLNPDTKMEQGSLLEMLKTMKEDQKRVVVQPMITLMEEPELINTWGNEYRGFGLVTLGGYREKIPSYDLGIPDAPINFASGACMLVKAKLFEEIGYFDQGFFMYYEDTEFSKRVKDAGYEIYLSAKAQVQHDYQRPYSLTKLGYFMKSWWRYIYVKG